MTIGNAAYLLIFLSACLPSLSKYFYMSYRQIIGGLYPSYLAYKALKQRNGPEITRLVMYFIVFQIYCSIEFYLDLFLSFWLPFYYESKLIFIFWLISPYGNGAQILYENLIQRKFEENEEKIDKQIDNLKKFAINSAWNLFGKFNCYLNRLLILGIAKAQMAAIQYVHFQQNLEKTSIETNDNNEQTTGDINIGPLIEIMDTDNDEMTMDQSSIQRGSKDEQHQDNDDDNDEFINVKKPLRKTKRKRRQQLQSIEDISSSSSTQTFIIQQLLSSSSNESINHRPLTRSQIAKY
ncbi:uncharacterized protein T19C3.4-like isoform X1 [Dermatophagoides pteronyssinus]|uniref:uncharacterized protein T19C3.4-like isoform X1 n=2 Tax=Dermatophagoides pteronyssinus TaxID=6956 RepID=UPI003F671F15